MKKLFTQSFLFLGLLNFPGKSFSQAVAPVYDHCISAVVLQVVVASTCSGVIDFHDNMATPSTAGTIPVPACGSFTDGATPDVWFKFTTTSFPSYQINIDPGTPVSAADLAVAVYTGGCNGPWTLAGCDDNGTGMPSLTLSSAAAGTEYYIRVWSNDGTTPGNFRICVVLNMGVSVSDISSITPEVSPIPFSDHLSITMPSEMQQGTLKIFNLQGKMVLESHDVNKQKRLDTSFLESGVYFLKIENEKYSLSKKIIKI